METKMLGMDWYNKFQCIGGHCPLTCCAAGWTIMLTDKEIEMYENMQHPFRDSILEQIDVEKKIFKNRGRYCGQLNDQGLCRIILECGEEYLSGTCKHFPRYGVAYGDVVERTVSIGCPVVAEYLFRPDSIEFDFSTCEMDEGAEPIDFDLYDGLSYIRTNLIETYESYGRTQPAAAAFLMVACLIQVKDAISQGSSLKTWAVQFADESFSEHVLQSVFAREEILAKTCSEKAERISSIWNALEGWLRGKLEKNIPDMPFVDWDFFWKLMGDTKAFEKAIGRFSGEFQKKYMMVYENYFVYALFKNFIVKKPEEFAKRMVDHIFEFMLIQTLAVSVYEDTGKLDLDTYVLIISVVAREIENRATDLDLVPAFMEERQLLTIDVLLSLLIF